MNSRTLNRSTQHGSVLILVTIGMVVLLGMAGLALDMGHAYLMKTRLQTALDAAALSGAQTLDITKGDTVQAEIDALNTFTINAGDDMNDTSLTPVVEFSDVLFDPAQALDPRYVRVSLGGYQLPMWFAQVLPGVGNNKQVAASAVSGPSPTLGEVCDVFPVMICGDPAGDDDCSDGSCFGYHHDPLSTEEITLKTGSGDESDVGPGNYQLIRLGDNTGANDLRMSMAGGFEGCIDGTDIETEPGNTVGPVAQGINTRFGLYQGPFNQDDRDIYKPDLVSDTQSPSEYYSDYKNIYDSPAPAWDHPDGEAFRRIVPVPIGDCSTTVSGQGEVPLLGVACFFLTRPAEQNGEQRIYGQIIPGCKAHGTAGPDPFNSKGPYKIQLYKDPDNRDA